MNDEIKPRERPFCGDDPTVRLVAGSAWVKCRNTQCRAETGLYRSESEAISRWNTRFPDARLAQAEKALAELRAIADSLSTAAKMMGLEDDDFALKQFTEWRDRNREI